MKTTSFYLTRVLYYLRVIYTQMTEEVESMLNIRKKMADEEIEVNSDHKKQQLRTTLIV